MSLSAVSTIALSGVNASALREGAASSNTANFLTPNFRRVVVSQNEQATGGVVARASRVSAPGEDLLGDAVARIGALYSFKANILSLKVADQMTGTVLDVRA